MGVIGQLVERRPQGDSTAAGREAVPQLNFEKAGGQDPGVGDLGGDCLAVFEHYEVSKDRIAERAEARDGDAAALSSHVRCEALDIIERQQHVAAGLGSAQHDVPERRRPRVRMDGMRARGKQQRCEHKEADA